MPRIAGADRLEFAARARSLFISGATVEWFLESATPGQLEACSSMLARELESRERSKRARLLRQARFPVHKTLEGFDWSNVGFPDGWGRDEMLSLGFAAAAEDLVLHGPTGRGKTHVATALGIEATARGIPVRFYRTASLVLQLGKAKREGTLDDTANIKIPIHTNRESRSHQFATAVRANRLYPTRPTKYPPLERRSKGGP